MKEMGRKITSLAKPEVLEWFKNVYGIGRKFFQSEVDDWVILDAEDLTPERLDEFIKGTRRIS